MDGNSFNVQGKTSVSCNSLAVTLEATQKKFSNF
jgi:hypothetical protein